LFSEKILDNFSVDEKVIDDLKDILLESVVGALPDNEGIPVSYLNNTILEINKRIEYKELIVSMHKKEQKVLGKLIDEANDLQKNVLLDKDGILHWRKFKE